MKLTDALFNWLQIRIVGDARPRDRSARDTVQFFEQILTAVRLLIPVNEFVEFVELTYWDEP